jgi:hypothetical protein
MEDEPIIIGGALIPIKIMSMDKGELTNIYEPRIDNKIAMIIASLICRVFNLQEVFNYPVVNLSPYSHTQLLEKPENVKKILTGIGMALYISYLTSKGYRGDEIMEILNSRKRFDEKLSRIKLLITGYDYNKMRKDIKSLPENLRFPMPEPSKSNNLMERLSNEARSRLESLGVRYMDLVFIPVAGVLRSANDILTWERNMKNSVEALIERLYVLNDAIDRAYDLKNSTVIASPAVLIMPTVSEKELRECLEDSVKNAIYAIENMSIYVAYTKMWMGRYNNLIYI